MFVLCIITSVQLMHINPRAVLENSISQSAPLYLLSYLSISSTGVLILRQPQMLRKGGGWGERRGEENVKEREDYNVYVQLTSAHWMQQSANSVELQYSPNSMNDPFRSPK